jgi:hypothetical protein
LTLFGHEIAYVNYFFPVARDLSTPTTCWCARAVDNGAVAFGGQSDLHPTSATRLPRHLRRWLRQRLYHRLVTEGVLPAGYATDNGVGLRYERTDMVEAVTEVVGKAAYFVERGPEGTVKETRIGPRVLQGAISPGEGGAARDA